MNSLFPLRQAITEFLACAVLDLFPGALLVSGEATEFGFYYDFIIKQPINEQAFPFLEEKMRGLIKGDDKIRTLEMMRGNAAVFLEHKEQPIRAAFIKESKEVIVPIFQVGEFCDYCPFPYFSDTQEMLAFKLLQIEPITRHMLGEDNVAVTRIHGTAFPDSKRLKKHIKSIEPAKKRDHRILGKEMELFDVYEEATSYSWFWHPNGAVLRELLLDWWRDERRQQQFKFVVTSSIVKNSLMKKARVYDLFSINSDRPVMKIEEIDYVVSSSLSPAHAAIYRSKLHSYKELPIRYAEYSTLAPLKQTGQLWGILNSRFVCSDAAHIFCTPEQLKKELISSLQFINKITKMFGFERHWYLRGRSQKFAGTLSLWEKSQKCLIEAFEHCELSYTIDEHNPSFGGPVAEVQIVDSLGREWKGPSIALDFNCPERFGLRYQGADDEMHSPIMVVQSIFGSLERFVAMLIEHYAGQFPLWLAPEQVRVLVIKENSLAYAEGVCQALKAAGYRVEIDDGHEQLGGKIHSAERKKVPYMAIIGEKEEKEHLITVRSSIQGAIQQGMTLEVFLDQLYQEVSSKSVQRQCGMPSKEIGSRLES